MRPVFIERDREWISILWQTLRLCRTDPFQLLQPAYHNTRYRTSSFTCRSVVAVRSLKRIRAGQTRATSATDDKILRRFRVALDELYGDRIERVVLFGSRARGNAHEASDYDIAVFLKDLTDRWREFHRLADLRTDILADTGVFIEARPFRAGAYRERTPLMHETGARASIFEPRDRALSG